MLTVEINLEQGSQMTSMLIWMLGIGFSISSLVLTAAMKIPYAHMAIAAFISILVALAAFSELRKPDLTRDEMSVVVGTNLRHMGLIWSWGAIGLLVTYAFKILEWREWLHFFVAFIVLAGLTYFLAITFSNDGQGKENDPTMIRIARGFAMFIIAAMLISMIGLLIDGKMWRFSTVAGQRPGSQDWAANNIFFFGALAQAAVAWNVLKLLERLQK